MSNFVQDWLPTLVGAAVFLVFSVCVIAAFSAVASRIEDRFSKAEMSTESGAEPGAGVTARAA